MNAVNLQCALPMLCHELDTATWLGEQVWRKHLGQTEAQVALGVQSRFLQFPSPGQSALQIKPFLRAGAMKTEIALPLQMRWRKLLQFNMGGPQCTLVNQSHMCPQSCCPRRLNHRTSTFCHPGEMVCFQDGNTGENASCLVLQYCCLLEVTVRLFSHGIQQDPFCGCMRHLRCEVWGLWCFLG